MTSGQPVTVSDHPHSKKLKKKKKRFLYLNGISWILVCAHFLLSHPWVPLRRIQFHLPSFQVFIQTDEIPLSFLYCRMYSHSSPSISSYEKCSSSSPSLWLPDQLVPECPCVSGPGEPISRPSTAFGSHQC